MLPEDTTITFVFFAERDCLEPGFFKPDREGPNASKELDDIKLLHVNLWLVRQHFIPARLACAQEVSQSAGRLIIGDVVIIVVQPSLFPIGIK